MGNLKKFLLAGTMLAGLTAPAHADPLSLGVAVLVNIGYGGAISGLGATILGSAILAAASFGLSLLSAAIFTPETSRPDPQQRQATVRQSVGPRLRFYGRVKVGGTLWFFEAKDGSLYSAITINEGEISAVREVWLNDQIVAVGSDGRVLTGPYERGTGSYVYMFFRLGQSDQMAYPLLVSRFPGIVTEAHRLRGVADVLSVFQEAPADLINEVYPQLNPGTRLVIDASLVQSVRSGMRIWSDNPADCIYDYLTAVDGAGFPYGAGFLETQIDLPSFQHFADISDEQVPLKLGGTVDRYNLWGGYSLAQEVREVIPEMLRTCDGDIYLTSEGKIALRGGEWIEPVLTLDDKLGHIISGDFRKGTQALAAFNELTITYTEPALDYQEVEGQRWVDTNNVALRGRVLADQIDFKMVANHSQARRLAKIHTHKQNPEWSGRILTNFYGFNALGEHVIRLRYSPLGIDTTFLVRRVNILPDMTGVELTLTSFTQSAYEWDAGAEEGRGPSEPPDTSSPIDLPPPDDINVSVAEKIISGSTAGTYIVVTWTEPERVALGQEVEYQIVPDGPWINMSVSDGAGLAESGLLADGEDYNVRVRTLSPGGNSGDWTPIVTVTATADTTTPLPVTSASGSGGDDADLGWTNSASLNSIGVRIYRNTVNNSGTATLISTVYGSPAVVVAYTDEPAPGTYYYWLAAINGSGGQSTLVALTALIVT